MEKQAGQSCGIGALGHEKDEQDRRKTRRMRGRREIYKKDEKEAERRQD